MVIPKGTGGVNNWLWDSGGPHSVVDRADALSYHHYKTELMDNVPGIIAKASNVASRYSPATPKPIWYTEWNTRDGLYHTRRDTVFDAAFALDMITGIHAHNADDNNEYKIEVSAYHNLIGNIRDNRHPNAPMNIETHMIDYKDNGDVYLRSAYWAFTLADQLNDFKVIQGFHPHDVDDNNYYFARAFYNQAERLLYIPFGNTTDQDIRINIEPLSFRICSNIVELYQSEEIEVPLEPVVYQGIVILGNLLRLPRSSIGMIKLHLCGRRRSFRQDHGLGV